jgi:Tol biopolymer transport system component
MTANRMAATLLLAAFLSCCGGGGGGGGGTPPGAGGPSVTPASAGTMVVEFDSRIWKADLANNKLSVLLNQFWDFPSISSAGELTLVEATTGPNFSKGSIIHILSLANGQELAQIPYTTSPIFWAASLSPDGTRIAFDVLTGANLDELATVVLTRSGTTIGNFPNTANPSWLPDGRLAMCGVDGILITDAALTFASRVVQLPKPAQCVASPDGSKIAFQQGNDIWIVGSDGTDPHLVISGLSLGFPSWSPDGATLAFVNGTLAGGGNQVWVVPAASRGVTLDSPGVHAVVVTGGPSLGFAGTTAPGLLFSDAIIAWR